MYRRHVRGRSYTVWFWCLGAYVALQVGVGVLVDCWPRLRDPEWQNLQEVLQRSQTGAARRPLVLVLGSSRHALAVRPALLHSTQDRAAPVLVNGAVFGAGVMTQKVFLRRVLNAGFRPQLVCVETTPALMAARNGVTHDERGMCPERFSAVELVRLWPYQAEKGRLVWRWGLSRALAVYRSRGEIRQGLAHALEPTQPGPDVNESIQGCAQDSLDCTPAVVALRTKAMLAHFGPALQNPCLADQQVQALHDLVAICRAERLDVVLVMSAESSAFRNYCPDAARLHHAALAELAQQWDVPLVDARTWIDDAGFFDGHHATRAGAEQYTRRLAREVIGKWLPESRNASPQLARKR